MNDRNHSWKSELERLSPEEVKELRQAHDQANKKAGDGTRTHDILLGKKTTPQWLLPLSVAALLLLVVIWFASGLATHGVDFGQAMVLGVFLISAAFFMAWLSRKVGL